MVPRATKEVRMARTRIGVVVGLAVLAIGVAGCGGGDDEASDTTTETTTETTTTTTGESVPETGLVLRASVGPGFSISLTTEDGAAVTTLAAGSYTLLTDDKSDIHNFHLTGEGVDVDTGVSESGTNSFDIDLQPGSYHYQCDPHASQMNGDFEVTG
jgi:plastocyanin